MIPSRALLLLALLLGAPAVALAQTEGHNSLGYQDSAGRWHAYDTTGVGIPFSGGTLSNTPPPITGFGTLALTATSTLLSTLTAGPNSAVWPASPGQIYVINQGSATIYACPLGGTCSGSVGITIPGGQAYGFYKPSTNMTLFTATTSTVQAQW